MTHTLATAPPRWNRVPGLLGVLGGLVLVAAFVPDLPWTREAFQLRLVLFNAGAVGVAVAVMRRDATSRALVAAGTAVVIANAWYLGMVVVGVGRPQPPAPDPDFRLVLFCVGAAMWLADAAFGFAALNARVVNRWGSAALAIGSLLAFTGMDRLELVRGAWAWIFEPASQVGIVLVGIGWIVLGADLLRRASRRVLR